MKKTLSGIIVLAMALFADAALAAGGEIAVIVKTTNSNFWQNVNKGASDAIKLPELKGYTMSFQGPAADPALARFSGMTSEDREYHSGLLLRNLMDSVRTGTKGGFMAFCRNLAEHRHREGYRVEDLVASLRTMRRVSLEIVGRDPEAVGLRQAIHEYLAMTVDFGVDQVLEVFEEHEIGALPVPEE